MVAKKLAFVILLMFPELFINQTTAANKHMHTTAKHSAIKYLLEDLTCPKMLKMFTGHTLQVFKLCICCRIV